MRRTRKRARRRRAQLLGLPLGIAALGAAVAGGLKWRSRRGAAAPETFNCDCGQRFRVAGRDRHRIYWTEGAPEDQPVLGSSCPNCDRPLPHGTARESPEPAPAVAVSPA